MIALEDFFPDGVVRFVHPPFDEVYWATFGIPARVQVAMWGQGTRTGLAYRDVGVQPAGSGARLQFGGSRKHRGLASDAYERIK